jgi:protein SCO1/2|tara:strand:+ start:1790 stop:2374 length:585 start_codon:yes stop_codon:yes gene_type:complete
LSQKIKILVYAGFGAIILAAILLRWNYPPQPELAVLEELPDFHLTDQSGNAFSRDDLTGKVWVADFIFTTCAGPCPIMSSQFTELQDRFSHLPDFRLLSISVNPEYDTPQVLKEYGDHYNADHSRWSFLTGEREAIHKLAVDGFHIGSVEDPIFHSIRFILVDSKGRIRGYYISSEMDEMKKLWRDVERLAEST